LIARTTRQAHPTEAGLAFAARVRPAVEQLRRAHDHIAEQTVHMRGTLRIAAPTLFGPAYVVPLLADFLQTHTQLQTELLLSDTRADLADGRIDVAVRLGALPDSGLRMRALGALRRVVVGAPHYFAAQGRPGCPEDLSGHTCLIRAEAGHETWTFGEARRVTVRGRFRSPSAEACNRAAVNGLGIARAPLWQVRPWVESGALEIVLAEHEPPPVPLQLVWPAGRTPTRVRAFIDHVAARLDLSTL
jgi:DNA-binding transcriptional LysR family regulator